MRDETREKFAAFYSLLLSRKLKFMVDKGDVVCDPMVIHGFSRKSRTKTRSHNLVTGWGTCERKNRKSKNK